MATRNTASTVATSLMMDLCAACHKAPLIVVIGAQAQVSNSLSHTLSWMLWEVATNSSFLLVHPTILRTKPLLARGVLKGFQLSSKALRQPNTNDALHYKKARGSSEAFSPFGQPLHVLAKWQRALKTWTLLLWIQDRWVFERHPLFNSLLFLIR